MTAKSVGHYCFDLARSGQFDPMAKENMLSLPARSSEVFYRDWHLKNRVLGDRQSRGVAERLDANEF